MPGSIFQETFKKITQDADAVSKLADSIVLPERAIPKERDTSKFKEFKKQVAKEQIDTATAGPGPYMIVQRILDAGKRLRRDNKIKKGTFQTLVKSILEVDKPEDFKLTGLAGYEHEFTFLTNWLAKASSEEFKRLQEAIKLWYNLSEVSGEEKKDPEFRSVLPQSKKLISKTIGALLNAYQSISLGNQKILDEISGWTEILREGASLDILKKGISSIAQNIKVLANDYLKGPEEGSAVDYSKINKVEDVYKEMEKHKQAIDIMKTKFNPELFNIIEKILYENFKTTGTTGIIEIQDVNTVESLPFFSSLEQYINPEERERDKDNTAKAINHFNAIADLDKVAREFQNYFSTDTALRSLTAARESITNLNNLLK